jgi:hypothetical protein
LHGPGIEKAMATLAFDCASDEVSQAYADQDDQDANRNREWHPKSGGVVKPDPYDRSDNAEHKNGIPEPAWHGPSLNLRTLPYQRCF